MNYGFFSKPASILAIINVNWYFEFECVISGVVQEVRDPIFHSFFDFFLRHLRTVWFLMAC